MQELQDELGIENSLLDRISFQLGENRFCVLDSVEGSTRRQDFGKHSGMLIGHEHDVFVILRQLPQIDHQILTHIFAVFVAQKWEKRCDDVVIVMHTKVHFQRLRNHFDQFFVIGEYLAGIVDPVNGNVVGFRSVRLDDDHCVIPLGRKNSNFTFVHRLARKNGYLPSFAQRFAQVSESFALSILLTLK